MRKYIIITLSIIASGSMWAQPAEDWYQQSNSKKNAGIDLYKSYEFLKGKTSTQIVVAVIDGGTDVAHEDLKSVIWVNPGEIAGNGIDDDKNGYIDDVNGWNFIGGPNGYMVDRDNLEMTRLLRKYQAEFGDLDAEDVNGDSEKAKKYKEYQEIKTEVNSNKKIYASLVDQFEKVIIQLDKIKKATGKSDPNISQVEEYEPGNETAARVKGNVIRQMKEGRSFKSIYDEVDEQFKQVDAMANAHYNVDFDPRAGVGDDYTNSYDRYYGNNSVAGPDASHGSHVAGIIAATRNNKIGMNGIADNVRIMVVRVVPNGDERDKDVANGIRYAVDNGAKIINMSFGKAYKWDKACVDSAVAYAVSKGVLLVHAAGNDGENNDEDANYPNDSLGNGKFAATWVEVGASAPNRKRLATDFSNYGKNNVDIFAPGYQIYSTIPDNKYAYFNGTSMAAPVTSGVAALVWSYYPKLTALQVKEILMKSAVVNTKKVPTPGSGDKIKFTELSVCGGVVNAYKALQLAATY
ncbi:MAG: S8 family peptidase [Bacteroidia bacterium]|nr:S8 family peptidase [Bacteroidia bacterium]